LGLDFVPITEERQDYYKKTPQVSGEIPDSFLGMVDCLFGVITICIMDSTVIFYPLQTSG
jgi:hypothetical protein